MDYYTRFIQPIQGREFPSEYDAGSPMLSELIGRDIACVAVRTLNLSTAGAIAIELPARGFVPYFYETASATKTRFPEGLVSVYIGTTQPNFQVDQPFPAKHNRGFRGSLSKCYVVWEAQENTSVDLVFHKSVRTPWMTDDLLIPAPVVPGGDNGEFQFNNNGAFAGSPLLATDGTNVNIQGPLRLTPIPQGSVLFTGASGEVKGDEDNFFWDALNFYLGIGLNGTDPVASVDIGPTTPVTISPVSAGTGTLNNMTNAAQAASSVSAFEDTGLTGYTANGTAFQYSIFGYVNLNGARLGSGPVFAGFTDSNDGQTFASNISFTPAGSLDGQVIRQNSPSNITQDIAGTDTNFIDANNMINNGSQPSDAATNSYLSDGSILNITYSIYAFKVVDGVRIYASTPHDIVFTDPTNSNYYIPSLSWTAVAGADGYKIIRSSDNRSRETAGTSLYDAPIFGSFSGNATVTPNTAEVAALRVQNVIKQSNDNWHINADATFKFGTNAFIDLNGYLNITTTFMNGNFLHMGGGVIATEGGSISTAGGAINTSSGALAVGGNTRLGKAVFNQNYTTSVPTTGSTVACTFDRAGQLINPAGTLATLTIRLPIATDDGQIFWVASSQIITAVTWQDGGGAANVVGGQATLGGTSRGQTFMYAQALSKWIAIS